MWGQAPLSLSGIGFIYNNHDHNKYNITKVSKPNLQEIIIERRAYKQSLMDQNCALYIQYYVPQDVCRGSFWSLVPNPVA